LYLYDVIENKVVIIGLRWPEALKAIGSLSKLPICTLTRSHPTNCIWLSLVLGTSIVC